MCGRVVRWERRVVWDDGERRNGWSGAVVWYCARRIMSSGVSGGGLGWFTVVMVVVVIGV